MKTILPPLIALLSAGCAAQSGGPCGESFCLPGDAQLLARETPVEDFNLYRVEWRGARFAIYEGNHPRGRDDAGRIAVRIAGGGAARLAVAGGRGSLMIETGQKRWPVYLDVTGPCPSAGACPLRAFAGKLRLRR